MYIQQYFTITCSAGNGGDINICDEYRMTLLHRTVVFSNNVRLTRVLCENGAEKNLGDCNGNSPLAALCEAFPRGMEKFSEVMPLGNPYKDCCNVEDKAEFIDYLLSQSDLQVCIYYTGACRISNH